jgi:hypothetical protein
LVYVFGRIAKSILFGKNSEFLSQKAIKLKGHKVKRQVGQKKIWNDERWLSTL